MAAPYTTEAPERMRRSRDGSNPDRGPGGPTCLRSAAVHGTRERPDRGKWVSGTTIIIENDSSLRLRSCDYGLEIPTLDPDSIPTVADFAFQIKPPIGALGCHLHLVSASLGFLAGFPWWDHIWAERWKAAMEAR